MRVSEVQGVMRTDAEGIAGGCGRGTEKVVVEIWRARETSLTGLGHSRICLGALDGRLLFHLDGPSSILELPVSLAH
jgi:hypothetical protein